MVRGICSSLVCVAVDVCLCCGCTLPALLTSPPPMCVWHHLQGLGTAVLAAILGSLPKTGGSLADHTVLLAGEGLLMSSACT